MQSDTSADESAKQRLPRVKDFIEGYSPILLRSDLKDQLKQFRRQKGFGHESHIERCLLSAGVELLLLETSLHKRWMDMLAEAVSMDVQIVARRSISVSGA